MARTRLRIRFQMSDARLDTVTEQVVSSSKYLQVKEKVQFEILDGTLKPGQKMPSERGLMRQFGVSHATIARALKELADSGLIVKKWGKGNFVGHRKRTVGHVAVTYGPIEYWDSRPLMSFMRGFTESAARLNWRTHLYLVPDLKIFGSGDDDLLPWLLTQRRLDGVVAFDVHQPEDIVRLKELGVPVVTIRDRYPGTGVSSIMDDVELGVDRLLGLLVDEFGHRRIRWVMGPIFGHTARLARFTGVFSETVAEGLERRGVVAPRKSFLHADFRWETIEPTIREWLVAPDRPTALVFPLAYLAVNALKLAREMGLRVPEDLSIAAWDIEPLGVDLTVVRVPLPDTGQMAVELLEALNRGQPPVDLLIPVDLSMPAATCGPAPTLEQRQSRRPPAKELIEESLVTKKNSTACPPRA